MHKDPFLPLYSYAKDRVGHMRANYRHVPLNSHDWDDFTQSVLIHIWEKRELIDLTKPWRTYIRTMASNLFRNLVRDRSLAECQEPLRSYRLAVRQFKPLCTKIIQDDYLGFEETIYEPDMAAPSDNIGQAEIDRARAIIAGLPKTTKQVLDAYEVGRSWNEAAKLTGLSYQAARSLGLKAFKLIRARLSEDSYEASSYSSGPPQSHLVGYSR